MLTAYFSKEEDISETRVTAGISNGIISSMQKGEMKELELEEMYKVLDTLEKAEREVFKKIEKYIK